MATAENETFTGIYVRQAQGDVSAHNRVLETFGAIFGKSGGERGAR